MMIGKIIIILSIFGISSLKKDNVITKTKVCFKTPVIMIPGMGGSQLQYVENDKKHDLWADPLTLLTSDGGNTLKVHYNTTTKKFQGYKNRVVQVKSFNNTETSENLIPSSEFIIQYFGEYFSSIVEAFDYYCLKNQDGLYGAAYDFRTITLTKNMELYIEQLKALIENIYRLHNQPVVLLSHSLGGSITNVFLNNQPDEWLQKYINTWISINGVFGPVGIALRDIIFGDSLNLPIFQNFIEHKIEKVLKTFPTIYSLMSTHKNSPKDKIVAYLNDQLYTVKNLTLLIKKFNIDFIDVLIDSSSNIFEPVKTNVLSHFIYSNGYHTPNIINIEGTQGSYYNKPKFTSDGDKTVTIESLEGFKNKINDTNPNISYKMFHMKTHTSILHDRDVIKHIMDVISLLQNS